MRLAEISPKVWELSEQVEKTLAGRFAEIDAVAKQNTMKVMDAFHEFRVSDSYFAGTTGYGYDDKGRDMLDAIYARVFGAEKALVRIGFVNGSHAISSALYGATEPGKILLSVTGTPYDTLRSTIGITGDAHGSMKYYGIRYDEVALKAGEPDYAAIRTAAANPEVSTVMIQRSRGYANRRALGIADIQKIVETVRAVNPQAVIFVDNCYGEFTETMEPPQVGVDLIAGSLIKNPGGGLAPTGGYIAGRADLVDRAANRMTTPGIGAECGSTLGNNRLLYQGFFMAPHTTAQALKTAVFCAGMLEKLGFKSTPGALEPRSDIIQMIELQSPERLKRFCRGIQSGAPVDAYVTPEPWMMPGYDAEVIMAAGAFIQGASIELSADGPMRPPYIAYLQGGLTYESGRLGILLAVSEMLDD